MKKKRTHKVLKPADDAVQWANKPSFEQRLSFARE